MGSKKIRPVTPGMRSQVATDFKELKMASLHELLELNMIQIEMQELPFCTMLMEKSHILLHQMVYPLTPE